MRGRGPPVVTDLGEQAPRREVGLAAGHTEQQADERGDDVLHERGDDGPERGASDHPDSQVEHVPAQEECAKLREHGRSILAGAQGAVQHVTPAAGDRADLLVLGDLHLGRLPTRLPSDLGGDDARRASLGPAGALESCVELAIAYDVAAVAFAGDVVDSDNARFEALGPLRRAVETLVQRGIDVLAIVGNHDAESLPRLARHVPGLRLIGAGGTWEDVLVRRGGDPVVRLVGWSFPAHHHSQPPLASLDGDRRARRFAEPGDVPVIGLLHGDLDQSVSRHAPIARADLLHTGYDAWLLGHVHAPSAAASVDTGASQPLGYLGCVTGCDPGEPGLHGAWLLSREVGGIALRKVPLAPVRYEVVRIDIADLVDDADVEEAVIDAATAATGRAVDEARAAGGTGPEVVACRVVLEGRGATAAAARDFATAAQRSWRDLRMQSGEATGFIEQVTARVALPHDLGVLAQARDPRGPLARQLIVLEAGGDEAAELLTAARAEIDRTVATAALRQAGELRLDDAALRQLLLDAGHDALDALVATREGSVA